MKVFVVLSILLAVTAATPATLLTSVPTLYTTGPQLSQYHSQDELGQYSYGYNGGLSAKVETRTLDGVTRGSYSYIDAEGKLQTVEYTADATNGFRAAATNLPKKPIDTAILPEAVRETPEVAQARADHLRAFNEIASRTIALPETPAAEFRTVQAPLAPLVATPSGLRSSFAYSVQGPAYAYTAAGPFYNNLPLRYTFGSPYLAQYSAIPLTYRTTAEQTYPAETLEVSRARAAHFAAVEEQKARIAAAQ